MRVHPRAWIVDARSLPAEVRLTYFEVAMTCSASREHGAEFDANLVTVLARSQGRRPATLIGHIQSLVGQGFMQETEAGWRFFVVEEGSQWIRCGLPRWYGSIVLVEIRPLGLDGDGQREGRVPVTAKMRSAVVERDGMVCGICGGAINGALHIDHIHPVARGGKTVLDNLQPAHPGCNLSKGARLLAREEA